VSALLHWRPTSLGARYATQSAAPNPVRQLLLALMAQPAAPAASIGQMALWSGVTDPVLATRVRDRMVLQGLLESVGAPYRPTGGLTDAVLSAQLAEISTLKRALLADRQGFCLASIGFSAEEIEGLAGFCAEIAAIRFRHAVGADPRSTQGVAAWQCERLGSVEDCRLQPLFIGSQRFTLLMSGPPILDNRALADMTWLLIQRYGEVAA
jgi:hypothetical protein